MIQDSALTFAENQLLTTPTPTIYGSTVLDLGSIADPGRGAQIAALFEVTETFVDDVGSPTLSFGVIGDIDATLTNDPLTLARNSGSFVAGSFSGPTLTSSELVEGARFVLGLNALNAHLIGGPSWTDGSPDWLRRYLGCFWQQPLNATASFSAGRMSARLVLTAGLESPAEGIFPSSFEVS